MATLKVRVLRARDLPVMDRRSQLADAYVEIRFNEHAERTPVHRNSLTPTWNHTWTLKVASLQALQEAPLEFKVYDYDVFSRDDLIGIVAVDLNIILSDPTGKCSLPNSWLPIFDTMRGLRGELELGIRIRFVDQRNPFCPPLLAEPADHALPALAAGSGDTGEGVLIFSVSTLDPAVYRIEKVAGMVEELLGKADPEHQTLQNFRASRTTNDARTLQFFRLSGKVRRQLGRKVLELGCNCVLGYAEQFDLERHNGIIIRGYGTACIISLVTPTGVTKAATQSVDAVSSPRTHPVDRLPKGYKAIPSLLLPGTKTQMRNLHGVTRADVQLITLQSLPRYAIHRIGGCVAARAVKVITSARTKEELMQERDSWWLELRDEMKMNARSMRCNAVIAYRETVALYQDLCILSASGTAAKLDSTTLGLSLDERKSRREERRRQRADGQVCRLVHRPTPFSKDGGNCDICRICRRKYVPEVLLATCEIPPELPVEGAPQLIEARVGRLKKKEYGEALAYSVSVELPWLESKMHTQLIAKLRSSKLNAAFGLRVDLVTGDTHIIVTAAATGVYIPALPQPSALPRFVTEVEDRAVVIDRTPRDPDAPPKDTPPPAVSSAPTSHTTAALLAELAEVRKALSQATSLEGDSARSNTAVLLAHGERGSLALTEENLQHVRLTRPGHSTVSTLSASSSTSSDTSSDSMSSGSASDDEKKSRLEEGQPGRTKESEFVIEVDDDDDAAMYREDADFPANQCICNVEDVCDAVAQQYVLVRQLMLQRRYKLPPTAHAPNLWVNRCFADIRQVLQFKLSGMGNCALMRYCTETTITDDNELNVILTGMLLQPLPCKPTAAAAPVPVDVGLRSPAILPEGDGSVKKSPPQTVPSAAPPPLPQCPSLELTAVSPSPKAVPLDASQPASRTPSPSFRLVPPSNFPASPSRLPPERRGPFRPAFPPYAPGPLAKPLDPVRPYHSAKATTLDAHGREIILTHLSYVPGATIDRYLGRISQHFLREAMYLSNPCDGGVGTFTHSVHVEANCVVHRLVAAAGGDALLRYTCHHHVIDDDDDKSTAYQFITIMGQMVTLKWPPTPTVAPAPATDPVT